MFGNFQEKQEEMRKKLAEIILDAEAGGGMVTVRVSATRELKDIKISPDFQYDDIEELEDLILTAINRGMAAAAEKEQAEAQNMLNEILPPGMGGLGDMFGM